MELPISDTSTTANEQYIAVSGSRQVSHPSESRESTIADMVNLGRRLLSQVSRPNYRLVEGRIEDVSGVYDTVVSIQSYYAWEDSPSILSHLYDCTTPGGTLVLATANEKLDIELLIRKCSREA